RFLWKHYCWPSRDSASRLARAFDAAWQRRVELETPLVDLLAAEDAVPVVAVGHALQGRLDARQLLVPLAPGSDGGRLLLDRVHARQAPDARLIELHGTAVGLRVVLGLQQLVPARLESLQVFVEIQFACHGRVLHMRLVNCPPALSQSGAAAESARAAGGARPLMLHDIQRFPMQG